MLIGEYYRKNKQKYQDNPYLSDIVLRSLIIKAEDITSMSQFFLSFDQEMNNESKADAYIASVLQGVPYQYVIQEQEFLGDVFYVDKRVLIPRMETQELVLTLIDVLKRKYKDNEFALADVGTGSGCIALEIKKHMQNACVFEIDISQDALEVASINSKKLQQNAIFFHGDKLKPLIEKGLKVDVIVSNPPYIENKEEVDENVLNYEPHLALFADDGISFYVDLFKQVPDAIKDEAIVALEFNYDQKERLEELIKNNFPQAQYKFYQDTFKCWRYVIISIKK